MIDTNSDNIITIITNRKPGKAQRAARPGCTNATVHFLLTYRLAMLLQTRKWPLKISKQRILAYVQSPTMQMSNKISGVIGPKFTEFVAIVIFHQRC